MEIRRATLHPIPNLSRRRSSPSRRRATCRGPAAASSSSCVPCSTIRPCSRTTIRSASRIVESRWAMMNAVRPCSSAPQRALDRPLGADVDRARRLVEDQDARVGEERPRERDELALPEREARAALAELRLVAVLEPSTNSSAPTARAAATTSSRVASGRPNAMFSPTVPAKRNPSCGTMPSWRRSEPARRRAGRRRRS